MITSEVVCAGFGVGDVADPEGDAVAHTGVTGVPVRQLDRRRVDIEAIDLTDG